MSQGFRLLRLEYIFSVIVPCLFAIYLNDYSLLDHLEVLAGFGFWAICGNTLNDLKDMDDPNDIETQKRTEGYSKKEIGVLSITGFILGAASFINPVKNHPEILYYLIAIVIMVVLYCIALKPVLIINWILLGVSHMWFPYFIIKINAGDSINGWPILEYYEWYLLACASAMALAGNLVHEIVDGDAITNYSLNTQKWILRIVAIVSLIMGVLALILFPDLVLYFFPFVLFPVGILYIARSDDSLPHGRTSIKDTGIIAGNMIFAFVIILILAK